MSAPDTTAVNGLLSRINARLASMNKNGFVDPAMLMGGGMQDPSMGGMPPPGMMPGMDPTQGGMMPPGAMPGMDPNAMMDPAMMGGGMPMDPSMMGAPPPDPSQGGAAPPPPPPAPGQQGTGQAGSESLMGAMRQGADAAAQSGVQFKPDQAVSLVQLVRMVSYCVARLGEMSGIPFDPMLMTVMPGEIAQLPAQPQKAPAAPAAGGAFKPPEPVQPMQPAMGGGGQQQPKQAGTVLTQERAAALAYMLQQSLSNDHR